MNLNEARSLLQSDAITGSDAFDLIDFAHRFWHNSPAQADALDLIVRLVARRDHISRSLDGSSDMIDDVLRFAGLYPYIDSKAEGANSLVRNCMSLPDFPNIIFHKAQVGALGYLLKGNSLILSAPTSFGKSLLVDVTIRMRHPLVVVIVVPTLALLDEYRRRIKPAFREYQIITKGTEIRAHDRVIFLGTQERIEQREDIGEVDLFIIDEFYKLDLKRGDERSASLNNVMSTYSKRARQVYLLGPSISSVNDQESGATSLPFLKSDFSPVAVDIERVHLDKGESKTDRLLNVLDAVKSQQTLVYLRSPRSTYKCGIEAIRASKLKGRKHALELAEWVRQNYHSQWILADCLEHGVGIHHGRIPRALAQYQIALFNDGLIDNILCTSSMIEGVNTKAKNVIIYDNYISTDKLDRFTFDNIKGRAGRMFQHFIGKVFLFGDAPLGEDLEVEIPLFNGFDNAPDEIIASMPVDVLGPSAGRRRDSLLRRSSLSPDLLRRWARYGIDGLNNLAEELADRSQDPLVAWSGQGSFDEMEATFDLIWRHLDFSKHNIRSGRQAAFYATRLRSASSIREFLEELSRSADPLKFQIEIDDGLNFLRAAEFTLPQVLMALQDIAVEMKVASLDYSILCGRLPMWFFSRDYQSFEESGVPFPTAVSLDISSDENLNYEQYSAIMKSSDNFIDQDIISRWINEEFPNQSPILSA
ncbi:DEAD/DEAH box helicase [Mesorhizobium sp.]|uniref:DEAD/DEAH box helicase n=1 Tax=Mesorhizobium sp. TaxID=1871066 RepID=UPI000FE41434|nr:DEAD/DEAH box helicase [Mesorhizobium sp.]RWH74827.1 MAG: hypothetical protein EOQ84_06670 [Mesorhizobium sp.]RWL19535.1 MAG: hypothetical protein EOR58_32180 [Mesorhizobium sp.]RWL22367.1 MAG: hypothetical protein EOR63_32475 [Mesorhizobium sp.]RWL26972.1 MAG: hypothetical protein EOR59_32195 [Mesorhizobium sp.]RWL42495.1 MAG: hypothetical protein EOR61_32020 [Mesorhizobium sp.]